MIDAIVSYIRCSDCGATIHNTKKDWEFHRKSYGAKGSSCERRQKKNQGKM